MYVVLPGRFGAFVRGLWSVCYNWGFFVTFGACVLLLGFVFAGRRISWDDWSVCFTFGDRSGTIV